MSRDPARPSFRVASPTFSPLYRQIKDFMIRSLEAGEWGPGDAIPSEGELAARFNVSQGTVRKAIDEMAAENLLIRRQGKGTFVAQHNSERFMFQFFHVEPRADPRFGEVVQQVEYPTVECVAFERDRAGEQDTLALRIKQGEAVLRFENRLSLGGRAVVHDRIVVPASLFRGLTEKRLLDRPSTIYSLYQTEFGITVLRAQERARAVAADRTTARILGLPAGLPVLEVHRIAMTFGERPVEYRISTIHTQLHDYVSVRSRSG